MIVIYLQLLHSICNCPLAMADEILMPSYRYYHCNVSYGNHCANVNTIYMALCYEPSDILIYVKGTSLTFTYPDDKHAIPINRFGLVCRNLKLLPAAIGVGTKEKMINKIETVT